MLSRTYSYRFKYPLVRNDCCALLRYKISVKSPNKNVFIAEILVVVFCEIETEVRRLTTFVSEFGDRAENSTASAAQVSRYLGDVVQTLRHTPKTASIVNLSFTPLARTWTFSRLPFFTFKTRQFSKTKIQFPKFMVWFVSSVEE